MNVSKIGTIAAVALICALFVSPALAGGYRDYAAEDLALVKAHQESVWTLKGYLMAHQNILEQHLDIERLMQDGTYSEHIDIPIDQTGYYETDLAQGTYRVTLKAWKGLGPDEVHMVVCEGYPAGVVSTDGPFIGHVVSHPSDEPVATPDEIQIVCALYGKVHFTTTPGYWTEWSRENPHKFGQQTRTVVDVPGQGEYYEHAFDEVPCTHYVEATYKQECNQVTTQVPCTHIVPAVPAVPAQPEYMEYVGHNNGRYDTTNGNTYAYKINGVKYKDEGQGHGDYTYHAAVPAVPAVPAHPEHAFDTQTNTVCVQVVDVPAHYQHQGDQVPCTHYHASVPAVTHKEYRYYVMPVIHQDGHVVDVKHEVQAVVDSGVRSFKFDNGQNPGGIFSTDGTLLQQIEDPAYGFTKSVAITYKLNGVTKVIVKDEYQTITI